MNKLKIIKITLLIIILAEEIKSVKEKKKNGTLHINVSDLEKQRDLLKNQNHLLEAFL